MKIFDLIFFQSLEGYNEGFRQSSNQFMQVIHGIQDFQDMISIGWRNFVEGLGIVSNFFSG